MSAVRVRISTFEYQAETFAWYEIYASEIAHDLADVVANAEFKAVFFGDQFLHANVSFGEEWFFWVRAMYDFGATEGTLVSLGSIVITLTGGSGSPGETGETGDPGPGTFSEDGPEPRVVPLIVTHASDPAITTGDGKMYFRVGALLDGRSLTVPAMHLQTVSSAGDPTVQIHNVTTGQDMLSTKLTIDAGDKDSKDALVPAVVDPAQAVVHTGDELRIDIDVAGTGAKGLQVDLPFEA